MFIVYSSHCPTPRFSLQVKEFCLFSSLLYPQHLEQWLAYKKFSVSTGGRYRGKKGGRGEKGMEGQEGGRNPLRSSWVKDQAQCILHPLRTTEETGLGCSRKELKDGNRKCCSDGRSSDWGSLWNSISWKVCWEDTWAQHLSCIWNC